MRLTLFLFALMPAAAMAAPQPDKVSPDVAIFETGVVCDPPNVSAEIAPDTVAGQTFTFEGDVAFVSTGNRVPAVLGLGMGTKTQMVDPAGLSDVTLSVTHPPMGPNGVTRQSYRAGINGTNVSQRLYTFDEDYELLPGIWQMQAEKDGRIIYRTTFEVVAPQLMPELAGVCGFENLLS